MKFTLPPQMNETRRILVRSHNNRVGLVVVPVVCGVFGGFFLFQSRSAVQIWALGVSVAGIVGVICAIRLSKRQSITLGYVCPLCGGPLYDGGDNRLGNRGECPCCKKFIIDKL
jgi:hypothetical protein